MTTHLQLKEKELYQKIGYFVEQHFKSFSKLITNGYRGSEHEANEWNYPTLVSFKVEASDKTVDEPYLYAFEFKRELTLSNLRHAFFQTVSNTSWANEGYLVTGKIDLKNAKLMKELELLNQQFGIGVILFDFENSNYAQILFTSFKHKVLDRDRIKSLFEQENEDFKDFICMVDSYFKSVSKGDKSLVSTVKTQEASKRSAKVRKVNNSQKESLISGMSTIDDSWCRLDEQRFRGKKIVKAKIGNEVHENLYWQDLILKALLKCREVNPLLFYKTSQSNKEGDLFFENKSGLWITQPKSNYRLLEKGIYFYRNHSADKTCEEVCKLLRLFGLPIDFIQIQVKAKKRDE